MPLKIEKNCSSIFIIYIYIYTERERERERGGEEGVCECPQSL